MNESSNKFYSLAAFDLDHTLLNANCSFEFGVYLFNKGHLSFFKMIKLLLLYVLQKNNFVTIKYLHKYTFECFFLGKSVSLIEKCADLFLAEKLNSLINKLVLERLKAAKERHAKVIILSSSPNILVKKISEIFNVDYWDSTIYENNSKDQYSCIEKIMEGEDKVLSLEKLLSIYNIKKEDVVAYSDSHLDLPLLNFAAKAVAVNPDKKLLKSIAQDNNPSKWEILRT